MVEKLNRETIADHAIVHDAPPAQEARTIADRTFELPPILYGTTVACFLGFLLITGLAFANPGLILPMVIFTFFILAGFGVPTIWAKLAPETDSKALSWARFQRDGIMTLTGRTSASQAAVQVLILPVLLVMWGLAVVTIAAIVR